MKDWTRTATLTTLETPWIRLIGERWDTNGGGSVDYWRTETDDSVIVIPEMDGQLLLPQPMFRPGVGRNTLDFPGGRCPRGVTAADAAFGIIVRELGVARRQITDMQPLTALPLLVNSSTSNQKLFGFHAKLAGLPPSSSLVAHQRYATDEQGVQRLLQDLECLQCRALLLEWLRIRTKR